MKQERRPLTFGRRRRLPIVQMIPALSFLKHPVCLMYICAA
jgi:hypothetical protein